METIKNIVYFHQKLYEALNNPETQDEEFLFVENLIFENQLGKELRESWDFEILVLWCIYMRIQQNLERERFFESTNIFRTNESLFNRNYKYNERCGIILFFIYVVEALTRISLLKGGT